MGRGRGIMCIGDTWNCVIGDLQLQEHFGLYKNIMRREFAG